MDLKRLSRVAHSTHTLYNPLGEEKLDRVLGLIPLASDSRVVDFGAGRCEALIRLVERYNCNALAVETDQTFIDLAHGEAAARIPGKALRIVRQEATSFLEANPACNFDLALCIGATHAFGTYRDTLEQLRDCVRPGGWLLVAECYWKQPPSPEYLSFLDCEESIYDSHEGNVRIAEQLRLVPLWASVASDDEWDEYEWRYRMNVEVFAQDNPDDPDHDAMLERIHSWNHAYLTWGRATLGFGLYLFRNA
jgi:SAM-dependent methyltransferase